MSLKEEINLEISQIDELLNQYKVILDKVKDKPPDKIELAALANIAQTFYTGIENILERIRKAENIKMAKNQSWHKELLKKLTENNIISDELRLEYLDKFRAARHVFIHNYSHFLDWNEMKNIVLLIEETWEKTQNEINNYLRKNK